MVIVIAVLDMKAPRLEKVAERGKLGEEGRHSLKYDCLIACLACCRSQFCCGSLEVEDGTAGIVIIFHYVSLFIIIILLSLSLCSSLPCQSSIINNCLCLALLGFGLAMALAGFGFGCTVSPQSWGFNDDGGGK